MGIHCSLASRTEDEIIIRPTSRPQGGFVEVTAHILELIIKSVNEYISRALRHWDSRVSCSWWLITTLYLLMLQSWYLGTQVVKAGVNVKVVFTSLNTAFLPISRSRFKRRQIPMLITLSTIWQFCVNFWVIFRCFGKERFFLKG